MNNKGLLLRRLFFTAFALLWATATYVAVDAIAFEISHPWVSLLWIAGFSFLIFNVIYMFLTSFFYLILRPKPLKEAYVHPVPKTAIIYPVKNETFGMLERISYTFVNNALPGTDLWVLSDSGPEYLKDEEELIGDLRRRFGESKIHYRHRQMPTERKQGNVLSWLSEHLDYQYVFICDADSMAPRGTVLKLIRKAEHPENRDIAVFQTFIQITHAKTRFANIQALGARLSQELYFKTYQALFGRQISFGHLCLIRTSDFIKIRMPRGVLSHDIWDTVYLDAMGKRVAFCHDVITWDESPNNYLEAQARDRRWAKGTLQAWPLVFKRGISFPMRFYVFYGIYMYLSHMILFLWTILNAFLADPRFGDLVIFKSNNTLLVSPFARKELLICLVITLLTVYGHKFVLLRYARLGDILKELFFSTIISLNNVFYQTVAILTIPFQKIVWNPMKKDPSSSVRLKDVVVRLWPTTLLGSIALFYGLKNTNAWLILSLPLLISFTCSIPITYWTGQQSVR